MTFFRILFSYIHNGEICVVCGKKTLYLPLCKDCISKNYLKSINEEKKVCKVCGKLLVVEKEICMCCREKVVVKSCDKVISLYDYRLWNKDLLFLWKIKDWRGLSKVYADFVYEALKKESFDAIVPVPPRKGKIRERGWDQIDELCQFLKFMYGIKVCNLLKRTTVNEQKKLDREGRLETIGKSYSMVESGNDMVIPETVVLIDDIFTTGSTVESCARVLKRGGVKKVVALTIFTAA